MNQHERRKQRKGGARTSEMYVPLKQMHSIFDSMVEGKAGQVVMISANAKGRRAAEELWPDIEWATDEKFSEANPADWLFTQIRVTKLPPHLEGAVPLAFANNDSLAYAVALSLQAMAAPRRVCHLSGYGRDIEKNVYENTNRASARSLFVEHVPAGTVIGMPEGVS